MTTVTMQPVHIIGGGLGGCEAAWQLANRGISAVIHEMQSTRSWRLAGRYWGLKRRLKR